MIAAFRRHWPEYLMEAFGLGLFMMSASLFAALLQHPGSPVRQALPDPFARRVLMGVAMGLTAVLNIYGPWGKRSGAHLNPAVTLTFWHLGKIETADAIFYAAFQVLGGVAGVGAAALLLPGILAHPAINYVATLPGAAGPAAAFAAEAAITFFLTLVVLGLTNTPKAMPYTGLAVGVLIALYISLEEPFSGMSMNPARSFASAWAGSVWTAFWIYLAAPPLAMLAAARTYVALAGRRRVLCAKLNHGGGRCIFRCEYPACRARA